MASNRDLVSAHAAAPFLNPTIAESCDLGGWENLKELFAQASDLYEQDNEATECLPLLHAVIKECHRFLTFYGDPSVLFTPNLPSANLSGSTTHSPDPLTPRSDAPPGWDSSAPAQAERRDSRPKNVDLPTAFHSLLGTALFLLGNLIAQDPSLAQPGEPDDPQTYWLAALDVFETGESIPSRTHPSSFSITEDWRMAIMCGRTLVCLADGAITRKDPKPSDNGSQDALEEEPELFPLEEPDWPQDSLFAAIARKRPLITRRMSLATMTIEDLMVSSMDQFSRGILHMPHPQRAPSLLGGNVASASRTAPSSTAPSSGSSFSRAKVLFTIASEVLGVAERMETPSERKRCASWADSVFSQMTMEGDTDAWREAIPRARARCWLIIGSAGVEQIEDALEAGSTDVLLTEEAQEARDGLMKAIEFFEQAKTSVSSTPGPELPELQPLFVESLITLANLTVDEAKREELYIRAQAESGGQIDLERMDES